LAFVIGQISDEIDLPIEGSRVASFKDLTRAFFSSTLEGFILKLPPTKNLRDAMVCKLQGGQDLQGCARAVRRFAPVTARVVIYYRRLSATFSSLHLLPPSSTKMSMLEKFKKGAEKAGIQATAFIKEGGSRAAFESRGFVQGFSLPGESEKAAKILESFLGEPHSTLSRDRPPSNTGSIAPPADPNHPESALNSIPKAVLQRARGNYLHPTKVLPHISYPSLSGLAVFQVLKAGFVFSGKAGSGLVIARLPDGSWSAPSCIATGGLGWGLQIGADITDFVVVLNSEDAVRAFSMGGNVTVGGNVSAAAGPLGTGGSVQASLAHPAPMFSYSKSKGASSSRFLMDSSIK